MASRVVPGIGRDDDALGIGERVDDGGFADVRAADDGKLQGSISRGTGSFAGQLRGFRGCASCALISRTWSRQQRHRRIHQILDAFAVDGADGENLLEAEPGKFVRAFFRAAVSTLLTATRTGLPLLRRRCATSRSSGTTPSCTLTTRMMTLAASIASSTCSTAALMMTSSDFSPAQQANAAGVHERERAGPAIRPRR